MTESQGAQNERPELSFGLNDFINILRKRWLVILSVFLVVASVGIYRTMRKTYIYQASVKIAFNISPDLQPIQPSGMTNWMRAQMSNSSYFTTQIEIVKSEPVARRVAESLNLIRDPNNQSQVEGAIGMIMGSISVDSPRDADMFIIKCVSADPELAMKIANATAESYIRYNDERRYMAYRKSMGGITEQMTDLEKKLEVSQKELIEFIEKEKITSYDDEGKTFADPGYTPEGREPRVFLDSLNNQKVQVEIELERLREKYFDAHPKVKKMLSELAVLNDKLDVEKKRLGTVKTQREKEIIASKQNEIKYSILKRSVEVNRQLYNTLLQKLKETDVGSEIDSTNVDIIEYAKKPKHPYSPNKQKEILFTLFMSLMLGLGVGAVLQYLDTSFKSVEDLESILKYPILSSIPKFRSKTKRGLLLLDSQEDMTNLKEAFRVLRTNLRFSLKDRVAKHIIITSSQKGEGKSTTTVNLGTIMAETGAKILLVDADLRVRSLKNFLGVKSKMGLSDYLSGEATFEETVVRADFENLSVVTAGKPHDNTSMLFESDKMKEFIRESSERFDYVIFDAPPVGYIIDASILSMIVDGVIMVVEAEAVSKKTVMDSVDQLKKAKAEILGIVLNKESYSRKKYYYKYYRYYSRNSEQPQK